jgi:hypothetical protein
MTSLNVPYLISVTDTSVGIAVGNFADVSELVGLGYVPVSVTVHPDELSQLITVNNNEGTVTVDFSTIKEGVDNFVSNIVGPSSENVTTIVNYINGFNIGTVDYEPFLTLNFSGEAVSNNVPFDDMSDSTVNYINLLNSNMTNTLYPNTSSNAGDIMLLQLDDQDAYSKLVQVDSTYSQVQFQLSDELLVANNIQFTQSVDVVPAFVQGRRLFLLPDQDSITISVPTLSGKYIAKFVAGDRTDMDITLTDPVLSRFEPTTFSTHGNIFAQIRRDISSFGISEISIKDVSDSNLQYRTDGNSILERTNISPGTYAVSPLLDVYVYRFPENGTEYGNQLIGNLEVYNKADVLATIFDDLGLDSNSYTLLNETGGDPHYGTPVGDNYLSNTYYRIVRNNKTVNQSSSVTYTTTDADIFSILGGDNTKFVYRQEPLNTDPTTFIDSNTSNVYDLLDENVTYSTDVVTKAITVVFDGIDTPTTLNYLVSPWSNGWYSSTDINLYPESNTYLDFVDGTTYTLNLSYDSSVFGNVVSVSGSTYADAWANFTAENLKSITTFYINNFLSDVDKTTTLPDSAGYSQGDYLQYSFIYTGSTYIGYTKPGDVVTNESFYTFIQNTVGANGTVRVYSDSELTNEFTVLPGLASGTYYVTVE